MPHHPFLQKVESESEGFSDEKIKLPEKMLSTDKAYTWGEVEKWLERISKFSEEINVQLSEIQIKGTAKLDGFAGYDDGKKNSTLEVMVIKEVILAECFKEVLVF